MAGHSKWANTKHRKARRDKDRMGNFTKMLKSIEAAASKGKGPENYTLVSAVAEAKKQSVPSAKIQAAIDRGAGSTGGGGGTSVLYEGHAAGGVAILVDTFTDNKKRTAPNMRHHFSKYGGNLGNSGSVQWMYADQVRLLVTGGDADVVMDLALEAGASDLLEEEEEDASAEAEGIVVVCEPADYVEVKRAIDETDGLCCVVQGLHKEPSVWVDDLDDADGEKFDNLIEALVQDEDVQCVYHNRKGVPVRISGE